MGEQERIIKKANPGKGLGRGETFWADGDYQNLRARATTKADVGLPNVPDNIAQVMQDAETGINQSLELLTTDVNTLKDERDGRIVEFLNLMPLPAFATVPYITTPSMEETEMVITAVDNSPAGEGVVIEFVDPELIGQPLTVEVIAGKIIVSHATNAEGEIISAAGTVENQINSNVDAADLVIAAMGGAGDITFLGQVVTHSFLPGKVCSAGHIFSDKNDLLIAIEDCDGVTNEYDFFRKITLEPVIGG